MEVINKSNIKFVFGILFITLAFLSFSSAHKQDTDYSLVISSNNATACNLSYIQYPDKSLSYFNLPLEKNNQDFNITISSGNFSNLGNTCLGITCTDGSSYESGSICDIVTPSGELTNSNQGYMIIGQLGIIALFVIIGFSFDRAKWKIRSFFFVASILLGVISLNSIRLIAESSTSLNSMGNIGLILGIIILSFMFLFMLINYTIEVFHYFKKKNISKWEVKEYD